MARRRVNAESLSLLQCDTRYKIEKKKNKKHKTMTFLGVNSSRTNLLINWNFKERYWDETVTSSEWHTGEMIMGKPFRVPADGTSGSQRWARGCKYAVQQTWQRHIAKRHRGGERNRIHPRYDCLSTPRWWCRRGYDLRTV
jgi:hypothetical protein